LIGKVGRVARGVGPGKVMLTITRKLREHLAQRFKLAASATDEEARAECAKRLTSGEISAKQFAELTAEEGQPTGAGAAVRDAVAEGVRLGLRGRGTTPAPAQVFGGSGGTGSIRVKAPSERYKTTRAVGKHVKTGLPVVHEGREVETASEMQLALAGAFFRWKARKAGLSLPWTEHDGQLFDELVNDHEWCGMIGPDHYVGLQGENVKALLDDSVSGGTSLVPILVDDAVIVVALLTGELLPFVTVRDVGARQVRSPTLGVPSMTWGIPSGTPMPLFDTTNLLGELDTSIFTITAALEIGLDLMSDSPVSIGDEIVKVVGAATAADLDRVIATGDGVTQPKGIFNTAGVVALTSANGAPGPVLMDDAESLIFGLPKQYRQPQENPMFVGNDINYRRFRAVPAATGYGTRALGFDYSSYKLAEYPYRVNNTVVNTKVAFAAMKRYVLFRRQGLETAWETGGKELKLKNLALLVARGRFGGRISLPGAVAVMTALPA
jgi:HK97 family phage major capsid protein